LSFPYQLAESVVDGRGVRVIKKSRIKLPPDLGDAFSSEYCLITTMSAAVGA
jgi:hypothetical protein